MVIRIEVVLWLTRAFGHQGGGRMEFSREVALGETLETLVADLVREYPGLADFALGADGSLACAHLCLVVNDMVVATPSDELKREIKDGDVVVMLPAFSGGRA